MKALKIIAGVLLALVGVLVLGIAALIGWVDLNDYKKEIEQLAADQNIELHIEGNLGWNFFPELGIHSGKLTVKPDTAALAAPVAFDSLQVGIQLLPLFHGEVKTNTVQVSGGELVLATAGSEEKTHIEQLHIVADGLNLQQQAFSLDISAQIRSEKKGKVSQQLTLKSNLQLMMDKALQEISILHSHHEIIFTGEAIQHQTASIKVDFSAVVNLATSVAELKNLSLAIDDTHLEGDVAVNFGKESFYRINLAGDHMDLDHYLASGVATPKDGEVSSTAGKSEPLIPAATVLAFPGDYNLSFQSLVVNRLHLSDFHLAAHATPAGLATIKELKMHLYEGDFTLKGSVDVRPALPQIHLAMALSPLQLEPALKDFLQVDSTFASGDMAFDADIATRGISTEQLMGALEGNFNVSSQEITLNKTDLTASLDASLLELLQTKLPALMSEENKTVMKALNGKGSIRQGLVKPQFTAEALCTAFAGRGNYNLPTSAIDYHVDITFPSADTTPACGDVNARLKDIPWPVVCKGSLADDPAKLCKADRDAMQSLVKKAAKKEVNKKLEKAVDEKLQKKFGEDAEQVKGLLKGLLH